MYKKRIFLWSALTALFLFNLDAKVALITGITGQDGSYLAEFLLDKGYEVHGVCRASLRKNILDSELSNKIIFHTTNLCNFQEVLKLVADIVPDEIYNFAGQTSVQRSFQDPEYTLQINGYTTLYLLEALKTLDLVRCTKFFQAGSSEMFGKPLESPQNENTPLNPVSPYGISKALAYNLTKMYREAYGLFACTGILFNHESPRRGQEFVTKKITQAVANIATGKQEFLELGNLDAQRDWGYAPDYVEAMWLMLQQDTPEDYVIATGETHTVREFVQEAFKAVGISLEFFGTGIDEKGYDVETGIVRVLVNKEYYRPLEGNRFIGDATKAQKKLCWKPCMTFKNLVKNMMIVERG